MAEELSMDQVFIKKMTDILEINFENELFGVAELAEELGVSRSQLHRKLHAINGKSASQFIREYRLEKAMVMLQDNVATASEIAYRVGFGSPTYFNTCFHDYYGYPPGEVKFRDHSLIEDEEGIVKTNSISGEKNPYTANKKRPSIRVYFIVILVLILIGQFAYNKFWNKNEIGVSALDNNSIEKSIAVLPLINIGEDDSLEYFSDGVTQEIIDELAKINTFVIIAFSSTYQYKKQEISHAEIAKKLNVNYIISGSSRIFKDSVKLSIELINPKTNERIWNASFNEGIDNAPTIQASIAKQVAKSLNVQLSPEEEVSLQKVNTVNGEAFKLFLHAKTEITKLTKEGYSNTEKFLKKALELDPEYSQAHTLLAWSYVMGGAQWIHSDNVSTYKSEELALRHIDKAIELNPTSSDIYLVRGNLNMNIIGLLNNAKKDVDYAIELNSWPRVPTNYCICTVVSLYVALGEFEKAKKYVNLSKSVDPENIFIDYDEALIYMSEGKMKEAQALFKKAAKHDIPSFNFFLGWSYYHDNQFEEAARILERAYNLDKIPIALIVAYLSNTHHKLGNQIESEKYRMELEKRLELGEHHINLSLAMIEAAHNNTNETLNYLEKSFENRDYGNAYLVNIDPIFTPFFKEPRFIEIRKKMQYYE